MSSSLWRFESLLTEVEYKFLMSHPDPPVVDSDIDIARLRNTGFFDGLDGSAKAENAVSIIGNWSEDRRSVPVAFIRNAMFGLKRKAGRGVLEGVELVTEGDTIIRVTGESLDQTDLDFFLECLNMCNRNKSSRFQTAQNSFLKEVGMMPGGRQRNKMRDHIERMHDYKVEVISGKRKFSTRLILEYAIDENGIMIHLSPDLINILHLGDVWINAEKRKALPNDLSKWLHAFISSHKPGRPCFRKVEDLYSISGSSLQLRRFRFELNKAFDALRDEGIIKEWQPLSNGHSVRWIRASVPE